MPTLTQTTTGLVPVQNKNGTGLADLFLPKTSTNGLLDNQWLPILVRIVTYTNGWLHGTDPYESTLRSPNGDIFELF
jgi:hypothetical protein